MRFQTPAHLLRAFTSLAKAAPRFLATVALLLTAGATTLHAQSALDGFDPNANGLVRVVVVQPDGKVLIGGDFTTVSPNGGAAVPRNRIARLNADGTLDTAFNPDANSFVNTIALQADGKVLVGGDFTAVGGQVRNRIARLDATTGAADTFNPNANAEVESIAVQTDGKIVVGGGFTNIGGQVRNRIARLDASTGSADSFDPNASDAVHVVVIQPDGAILAGGAFATIGGQARNRIARLNATSGAADAFNPNGNGDVRAIAIQPDGKILVGGGFTNIGGQPRNSIARLQTNGAADTFNPGANGVVRAIALQADGKILVGGGFNGASSIGGQTRNYIARLDAATGVPDSFDPNANGVVRSIAVQADRKVLAGGNFTSVSPSGGAAVTRNRVARFEIDGRLDQTLDLGAVDSGVFAMATQADGKILIGGNFTTVLGVARNRIARLNTDGTLDTAFNPNADNTVNCIAVQADGKILVGGNFTSIGGQTRSRIARLDPSTGLADSFDPTSNSVIYTIAVQPDGKILVGGNFFNTPIGGLFRSYFVRLEPSGATDASFNPSVAGTVYTAALQLDGKILVGGNISTIGGETRNKIGRVDATGALDSFNPNADGIVRAIVVQPDGKVLVGGNFTTIGGQTRNHIARLNSADGTADSFDPNTNATVVQSIALQADGKILIGGDFTDFGGFPLNDLVRNRIARLDPATGVPDSFNPNANQQVYGLAIGADGKVLVGGNFTTIGGQPRNYFARLTNDTAALQEVTATQTTVTWTRAGSSPQFSRVSFESSTDGATYTLLGAATQSGSNWTLTDQNLPTGQNLYVRARGYHRTGYHNGSESTAEAVRNVYINAAAALPTLAINSPSHTEGNSGSSAMVFTVSLSAASSQTVTVNYTTANDSAVAGSDYTAVSGTLTFNPGMTSRPISVPILGDVLDEPDETFTVTLSAPTNAAISTATGTGTILDNDAAPTFSINNASKAEGNSGTTNMTFTVALSAASGRTTSVMYATSPVSATSGTDYTAVSGTASFPPGTTSQTIDVPIVGDPDVEPNETFTVTLSAAASALIANGTGTGTILNDDAAATPTPTPTPTATPSPTATPTPTPTATPQPSASPSPTATPQPSVSPTPTPAPVAQALNISTRTLIGTGGNALIGGFIVTGSEPKRVILRAIAPSLKAADGAPLPGALQDPTLELYDGAGDLIRANDNWRNDQEQEIKDSTIPPGDDRESAIVETLQPGNYTAIVRGRGDSTGIGLVEVYDLDSGNAAELAQISTRGDVQRGDNAMIGGFIIGGAAATDVLVRVVGPQLAEQGVPGVLGDPTLELYDGNGEVLAFNDNWRSDQEQAIVDTTVPPKYDEEPAIVRSLPAGNYTAVVRGRANTTGVALVEVYVLN